MDDMGVYTVDSNWGMPSINPMDPTPRVEVVVPLLLPAGWMLQS